MTDPFERHSIDHLSPSSLRLFRDAPAVWCGKYLLKAPDEVGPGAWRGKAIEAGVDRLLYGFDPGTALQAVQTQWDLDAQGIVDPDAVKEYDALPDFLVQAGVAFAGMTIPLQRQAKIELTLPGISVPLIGYADWIWEDRGDDLKTSWRMPNGGQPDPAHVEQVACYAMHFGIPFSLTYTTPKKWTRYEVTPSMASEAWDRVLEGALALKSFLSRVDNGIDALSCFSPDYSSFYFRPAMAEAVRAAKRVQVLPTRRD
jgi:hypothetical protein